MANNKKIFTIEINGLEESIKAVDALQEKINALQKTLKEFGKNGIEIPIEFGDSIKKFEKSLNTIKQKASKITLAPTSDDAEYNKLLAERQKQLAAVNRELADTKKNVEEYKQETKDLVALEKKARNEAKEYANTMNGLKQELKDLNSMKGNILIDSDEYADVSERIYEITSRLKDLEGAQGIFGRNVGDYTGSIKEAFKEVVSGSNAVAERLREVETLWNELYAKIDNNQSLSSNDIKNTFSVNELNTELSRLKKEMDNAISNDDYERLDKYYQELKLVSDEFKRFRGEVVKADNALKTQLTRTVNGQTYTWETLTSAVGELEDKLYQLAANGKRNTKEFDNIAKAAAELKMQLRQVDYEIDSMTESSKGINKMVSMTQGFTAIAQGTVGIGQLFGMDSENAMRGIQTMTALQGIASALQTVQEHITQNTAFGKTMEKWIDAFKIFNTRILLTSDAFKEFLKTITNKNFSVVPDNLQHLFDLEELVNMNNVSKKQKLILTFYKNFRDEYFDILKSIQKYNKDFKLTSNIGDTFTELFNLLSDDTLSKESKDEVKELFKTLEDFANRLNEKGNLIPDNFIGQIKYLGKEGFKKAAESAKSFASSLVKLPTYINLISKALKLLAYTIQAIISFGIGILFIEAIGWLTDIVSWTYKWVVGNDKLVNSLNKVETEMDLLNKSVDRYIRNIQRLREREKLFISDTEEATLKVEAYEKALLKATLALIKFNDNQGGGKDLSSNLTGGDTWFQNSVNTIEEFRKRYEKLQEAVEASKDIDEGNWFQRLWSTKSDAKADLGEMQIAVIKDLQNVINNLDLSKGTEEVKRFYDLLQDPMYASAFANVENLFPEKEWAQVLKKRVEQVLQMYEQFDEAAKDSAKVRLEEEKRLTQELVDYQTRITQKVRDNNTEAIKDEYARELEALRNAKRDELNEAEGNLELIISINKKYNRLEMEMIKKHNKDKADKEWDITELLRQIRDNKLSADEESLKKNLQTLENERNDAIEDAQKAAEDAAREGRDLNEVYNQLILSINIKYDALIKKEKEQYYKELLELDEQYYRAVEEIELQRKSNMLDNKAEDIEIKYNAKLNASEGFYDYDKIIESDKKLNTHRLQIELDYLEQKKKLDEEYASYEKQEATLNEGNRYEDAIKQLKDYKEQGKLTLEEFNRKIEQEEELHILNMENINIKFNNDMTTINNTYINDRKSLISSSLKEEASIYQEYVNQVNDILGELGKDTNAFGIISYKDTKQELDKAYQVVKTGIANIDSELISLEKKKKSKQISFIDYVETKKTLEQTKKELKKQGKDITEQMDDLLKDTASQWKSLVDSWVSQISSLLSTMNDTQMILIDNQLAEIEHQLEIQEEAYEKAEEAAQAHKDKMDSIEDELADARGSRRQFLIDTLAAQQAAYLEDVAAQQKAEEEKAKLEEKQKALEKKRQEQEKKAKVQQAVINTYMAVSNALAVQPWFVGLALSAVAMALGMKNVSAIKSTPIYEDGGVIQGARHSQGGVKVLGGTAEVEGGEFITNRKSTAANLPLLTYINDKKREVTAEDLINFFNSGTPTVKSKIGKRFASGGQLPTTDGSEVNRVTSISDVNEGNKTYVVQVVDIINAQKDLERVQVLSGLINE